MFRAFSVAQRRTNDAFYPNVKVYQLVQDKVT
jgi:hypothetical protein